jgi:hypothetical protein
MHFNLFCYSSSTEAFCFFRKKNEHVNPSLILRHLLTFFSQIKISRKSALSEMHFEGKRILGHEADGAAPKSNSSSETRST